MRLTVRVIPNARKIKIVQEPDRLKVYIKAPAVDGKANRALLETLSDHLGIKKSQIKIIRGEKSRDKVIEYS